MPSRATVVRCSTNRGESGANVIVARQCSFATVLVATATCGATCAKTSPNGLVCILIIEDTGELRRLAIRVE
jgi:hypothetical protein